MSSKSEKCMSSAKSIHFSHHHACFAFCILKSSLLTFLCMGESTRLSFSVNNDDTCSVMFNQCGATGVKYEPFKRIWLTLTSCFFPSHSHASSQFVLSHVWEPKAITVFMVIFDPAAMLFVTMINSGTCRSDSVGLFIKSHFIILSQLIKIFSVQCRRQCFSSWQDYGLMY